MRMQFDGNNQPYIEWQQLPGIYKRAWIRRAEGDKDWAQTGRYINVVRCDDQKKPAGNSTDFPIFNELPDEQVLTAFVHCINAITGCSENNE